jgi:NADP-dependent 3-hydroxy acid dehydrogenase YdfG
MVEGADPPLFGRGALVTGAGRGIGRAIAQRLAASGATVLCVSRTQSELDETVRSAGSRAFALALDISRDGAAQMMVDALMARAPSLDILVHCAAIITGSVEGMDLVDFDRAFGINVRSPYALTQATLDGLCDPRDAIALRALLRDTISPDVVHAVTQGALKAFTNRPGRTATLARAAFQPEDIAELACHALSLPRTAEDAKNSLKSDTEKTLAILSTVGEMKCL